MRIIFRVAAFAAFLALPAFAAAQYAPQKSTIAKLLALPKPKAGSCIVPASAISISPPSFTFPTTAPGTCATPQAITVSNPGTAPVSISGLFTTPPGDPSPFSTSTSCEDISLAPGASCGGTVTFCASGPAGGVTGSVQVYSDAPGSPHAVPAFGTVGPSAPQPAFSVSPSGSVGFGTLPVGTTSFPPVTFTVTNTGGAPMTIGAITTSSTAFAVSSNACPASLAAGASCAVGVTMTPESTGAQFATLYFNHNAPGTPTQVSLTGTGLTAGASDITFIPGGADFGYNIAGSVTSTGIDVKNVGALPLNISSLAFSGLPTSGGAFAILANTCVGTPVPSNGTCHIDVQFTAPMTPDYYQDSLVVTSDSTTSPNTTYAAGYSRNVTPNITFSPSLHDFGPVNVGSTVCVTVTITNNDAPSAPQTNLDYRNYALPPPFSLGTACPTTCTAILPGGSSCTVGITYQPTDTSTSYGTLDVYDYNSDGDYQMDVQGTGFQPGPRISLDQSLIDFGSQLSGTTSASQVVNVSNIGTATLTVGTVSVTPPFNLVTNTCLTPLAPMAACAITVTYTAGPVQPDTGTLSIFSDTAPDSGTVTVDLVGESTGAPQPSVDYFPENLAFGNVLIPTTSAPRSISFANTGAATLNILGIAATGEFTTTNDCPAAMAPGTCCTITATFHPTVIGPVNESIVVTSDSPSGPDSIPLSGTGMPPPSITPSVATLSFGSAVVGTFPAPQFVILTNTGIQTGLYFAGFNISGPGQFYLYDPSVSMPGLAAEKGRFIEPARPKAAPAMPQCFSASPFNIGSQCYIAVWWAPTTLGTQTGTLAVNFTGGTGSPTTINLVGLSRPVASPDIGVSSTSLTISGVIGRASEPAPLTVTNTGTAALTLYGLGIVGGPFTSTHNCPVSLEPGLSCTVFVIYRATVIGNQAGTLLIQHDANAQGILEVALNGIGLPIPLPKISVSPTTVDFGTRSVGSVTPPQTVVVRNAGTARLTIGTVQVSPGFALATQCGDLPPGGQCTIELNFRAGGSGRTVGTLAIPSNDPGNPTASVQLGGSGCRALSLSGTRTGVGGCPP
ncbi:hypothetical protein BWI17_17425 [Betaproteobacteria bacterium GR16-43]|nr:hypothetical protein BWI17_17425 [Betaproteobacteria bacterium GR16-43]